MSNNQLAIWDNGSEFVIAYSAEDALKVCEETGITFDPRDLADMEWSTLAG